MGKLLNSLNAQLKTEHKKSAEDCLKIYNYLKEINNGSVWASQWNSLVITNFEGSYPNSKRISKLNNIGILTLKGLKNV